MTRRMSRSAQRNLPLLGSEATRQGLFYEAVRALEPFADFARAVDALPLPGAEDLDGFLDDLCRAAAGIYCGHPESRIAYVHAVTLPSALRWLAPLLDPANARLAAGHVFQAVAALHALFGAATPAAETTPDPASDPEVAQTAQDWNEIRYRAACSIQEHAIKMADACWRESPCCSDPILSSALAAADAAIKLEGTRSAGGC